MAVSAEAYTIDQQHLPEIFGQWSALNLAPTGQEFVPQSTALDVVELWIDHGSTGTEPPTDLFVRIRAGSIDGTVLGTSGSTTVFDDQFGPVRFDFSAPVPLSVGATHVIEVVVVDAPGAGNPLVSGAEQPNYGAGRAILIGTPRDAFDLWFITGRTDGVDNAGSSWSTVKQLFR